MQKFLPMYYCQINVLIYLGFNSMCSLDFVYCKFFVI